MPKFWNKFSSWEAAEVAWDTQAEGAAKSKPNKKLNVLPEMPGITEDTAKHLKWKSFKWILTEDHTGEVRKGFLSHPFKYGYRYLKSLFKSRSYEREGDFFFYGIKDMAQFEQLLKQENTLFVLGFSYCHKPFECPSGRFTDACIHAAENPVCQQCFIGKAVHAAPEKKTIPLFIPTVHYIGAKMMELVHANPNEQIIFLITACEMTLEMFGDWGNMVGVKGIGVRLDGRICNTMKAFELSEKGIKPGLTVVLEGTQEKMLEIIKLRRSAEK